MSFNSSSTEEIVKSKDLKKLYEKKDKLVAKLDDGYQKQMGSLKREQSNTDRNIQKYQKKAKLETQEDALKKFAKSELIKKRSEEQEKDVIYKSANFDHRTEQTQIYSSENVPKKMLQSSTFKKVLNNVNDDQQQPQHLLKYRKGYSQEADTHHKVCHQVLRRAINDSQEDAQKLNISQTLSEQENQQLKLEDQNQSKSIKNIYDRFKKQRQLQRTQFKLAMMDWNMDTLQLYTRMKLQIEKQKKKHTGIQQWGIMTSQQLVKHKFINHNLEQQLKQKEIELQKFKVQNKILEEDNLKCRKKFHEYKQLMKKFQYTIQTKQIAYLRQKSQIIQQFQSKIKKYEKIKQKNKEQLAQCQEKLNELTSQQRKKDKQIKESEAQIKASKKIIQPLLQVFGQQNRIIQLQENSDKKLSLELKQLCEIFQRKILKFRNIEIAIQQYYKQKTQIRDNENRQQITTTKMLMKIIGEIDYLKNKTLIAENQHKKLYLKIDEIISMYYVKTNKMTDSQLGQNIVDKLKNYLQQVNNKLTEQENQLQIVKATRKRKVGHD